MVVAITHLKAYLELKREEGWSASTLRSEEKRLSSLIEEGAINGDPAVLWKALAKRGLSPYSKVTTWTVVGAFWDFVLKNSGAPAANPYKEFRRERKKLFRHAYKRRPGRASIKETREKVAKLTCPAARELATFLLATGCRFCEARTFDPASHSVVGKGGGVREVYGWRGACPAYPYTYQKFWQDCRAVGLKPHDFRKAVATEASKHLSAFELKELMGWSDLRPAMSYVGVRRERLEQAMKGTE